MTKWGAYWRLARLNKPVGILLLWYPTAWALWIANKGSPSFKLFSLFLIGTVFMRSAGCVINDIADRNVDLHVARTKLRPLTSGEISLVDAFVLLIILLFCSLIVLINLPQDCFYLALVSLFITFLYPFCKRFLNAPQIILGLAFSMGMPMAYVASSVPINVDLLILLLINFAWIIAYDTMYAMTDKEDDLKIGVRSTAIYFADYDRFMIGVLMFALHSLWLLWALMNKTNLGFYLFWCAGAGVLFYQMKLIQSRKPQKCFRAFLVSSYYGALMWASVCVSMV
ncbi:4-hydroxybenzoate octaprenyltransferase [Legionella bononiensis]|uniref:4-hydroxybenzoate octaprenyltransferase n=1 Tax=Legionella bononiensis TaxID=2793102 RepID=A0ABS1W7Y8_9GAMM|nr:4-hydroxybenzoate octaprenyltransferase [Legionella bononiensis]MBL7525345.1 4-hydroxybenzoate octaprenyltransferase [Legionella bononiensis]MBL7561529.1 4-hydroxybenzoate octaprenyltransferase [Legionella bononiensis]